MAEASTPISCGGRLAAENFDLRLRLVETRERMAAICADRLNHPQVAARLRQYDQRPIDPLEDQRNRRLLCEHLEMCRAIASSMAWRLIEIVMRPFDRTVSNPAASISISEIETIEDPLAVRRLLDETGEYLACVYGSQQWRWLQGARGAFGRRW